MTGVDITILVMSFISGVVYPSLLIYTCQLMYGTV